MCRTPHSLVTLPINAHIFIGMQACMAVDTPNCPGPYWTSHRAPALLEGSYHQLTVQAHLTYVRGDKAEQLLASG